MAAYNMDLSASGYVIELTYGTAAGGADMACNMFCEEIDEVYCIEYTGPMMGYLGLLETYCVIPLRDRALHSMHSRDVLQWEGGVVVGRAAPELCGCLPPPNAGPRKKGRCDSGREWLSAFCSRGWLLDGVGARYLVGMADCCVRQSLPLRGADGDAWLSGGDLGAGAGNCSEALTSHKNN